MKNQIKEPISIPQPGKNIEVLPVSEPVTPKIYPDENPIENPQIEPIQNPPYTLPKPDEFS